jgi:hypothetical protein
MSQSRIEQLQKKHGELERQIHEELKHPSADDLKIAEMKRQKLQIKDEIMQLQTRQLH